MLKDLSKTTSTSDEKSPRMLRLRERSQRVVEAAAFLGITVRMVYLGLERKQIPHLRVMGRSIKTLKCGGPVRAPFNQEVGIAKTK
jgi:hypothetical protein